MTDSDHAVMHPHIQPVDMAKASPQQEPLVVNAARIRTASSSTGWCVTVLLPRSAVAYGALGCEHTAKRCRHRFGLRLSIQSC